MYLTKCIFCMIFIRSCVTWPFFSNYFGSKPEENYDFEDLEPISDEMLFQRPSDIESETTIKTNATEDSPSPLPAEVALSTMSSMLNSPSEETKKYAAQKIEEFDDIIRNDPREAVWFNLGTSKLYLNLGLKGSLTRAVNEQMSKSLVQQMKDIIVYIWNLFKSLFVSEKTDKNNRETDKADESTNLSQGKTQERNIEHYIIVDKKNEENPNKSKEVTDEKKSVESRKSAGRSDLILNNHMVPNDGNIDSKTIYPASNIAEVKLHTNGPHVDKLFNIDAADALKYYQNLSSEEKLQVKEAIEKARAQIIQIRKEKHDIEMKIKSEKRDPSSEEWELLKQLASKLDVKEVFVLVSTDF